MYPLICRHRWIRERRPDGTLGLRCMRCLKRREHRLAQLIEWNPDYCPIEQPVSNISPVSYRAHN